MARPQNIDDEALIAALAGVFRDYGFEGASLTRLADAAGLQKASLYHRFPGGKEQMASEVLTAAYAWLQEKIIAPLRSSAPPMDRLKTVSAELRRFYDCGRKACLLNMLASPIAADGPFAAPIRSALELLIDGFAGLAREAGASQRIARRRGENAVALLQGSLVLARGLGDERPFSRFLGELPGVVLEGDSDD